MPLVNSPTLLASEPAIALGNPVDARPSQEVGSLSSWYYFPSPIDSATDIYVVGEELAFYANSQLEVQLVRHGFIVTHQTGGGPTGTNEPTVNLSVMGARFDDIYLRGQFHLLTAPLRTPGSVEIKLTVRARSGKEVFSKRYNGTGGYGLEGSLKPGPPENPISYAVQDAIAKVSDDPAFIAAIRQEAWQTKIRP